ncbi:TBC-domain-containing protein [Atractiella rhizophila]|nr:TBC-domain-containing protein [Atractiella rhizophila]
MGRRLKSLESRLSQIRKMVLVDGLDENACKSLRPVIWKLFLGLHNEGMTVSGKRYYELTTTKPPSVMFQKIKNDTFRTLATDKEFREKVGERRLVRLLEGWVWNQLPTPVDPTTALTITPYVQGMNVISAPFLYVMPSEVEAFNCFRAFVERECPRYVCEGLEGVHEGLKLLDKCLAILDPPLFQHLRSKSLSAELYAFPSVLTFSACTPPLEEVLHLWDFLLAFGPHLNILIVIAQMYLMRDDLLNHSSPMRLLRIFPPLPSTRQLIPLCCHFVEELPEELYERLARHCWEATEKEEGTGRARRSNAGSDRGSVKSAGTATSAAKRRVPSRAR